MALDKKTRSLLAIAAVAGVTLAACAGPGNGTGAGAPAAGDPQRGADAKTVTLTIADNSVTDKGGKGELTADWITNYVIPGFTKQEAAKGVTVTVNFQQSGADDEAYLEKESLDLKAGNAADVIGLDGIWVCQLADAGYLKPLDDVVGQQAADGWDGWAQVPKSMLPQASCNGKRYGTPGNTDVRVLFFNKDLFAKAGLPADWQPKSWDEILDAATKLKALPGITPLQINAGTPMGEATTMQGILPLLAGTSTGQPLQSTDGKWQGNTGGVRDVLSFYQKIYSSGLGDPQLQQEADGRDKSFQEFAAKKIGILLESDDMWREVIEPKIGTAPMADRDTEVGYTKIPAMAPGKGFNGQDFVTMSGGGMEAINPATKFPQQTWELMQFMNSADAIKALLGDTAQISQRTDVNNQVLDKDPMLKFAATQVQPLTAYRPGVAAYPQISQALQEATAAVVSGTSPADAAAQYSKALEDALGDGANIINN